MSEIQTESIEKYGLSQRNQSKKLFSRIGIVGCGKDGSLIATQAAMNGIEVIFLEPSQEKISGSFNYIEERLDKKIQGWGMTKSEKKLYLGRIKGTTDYQDLAECDFVIEAIRYNLLTGERGLAERKSVFKDLERVLSPKAIIASNVTTVTVSDLVAELEHKDRCVGLHFISNVPASNILEIVRSADTSDETYEAVCNFAKMIRYQYVPVLESAGLISMRLFLTQLNEACSMLMEGISSVEDIDKIMRVGFGYRQGVFLTADLLGIEKIVKLMENMYDEFGEAKYKPSPLLRRMARAKLHGVRVGKGFYNYDEKGNVI